MAGEGSSQTIDNVDLSDPCARYAALNRAYLSLMAGMHEVRIVFRDGDSLQEVNYTPPNLARLAIERSKAQMECMSLQSGRPARRAITAG